MAVIDAKGLYFDELNERVRGAGDNKIVLENVNGQRYIGSGADSGAKIDIIGTAGNAVGAYLNGAEIEIFGNAQDAAGDTMNAGLIIVHGRAGDGLGYSMRGGEIFVEGDIGYRAGIHMKEYKDKKPAIVAGGCAGSFLGEYQAGGIIIVLGDGCEGACPVGNFCGMGMHGGKMYIRSEHPLKNLPDQVLCERAGSDEIVRYIEAYCAYFEKDARKFLDSAYFKLTPNTKNPYKRLYAPV